MPSFGVKLSYGVKLIITCFVIGFFIPSFEAKLLNVSTVIILLQIRERRLIKERTELAISKGERPETGPIYEWIWLLGYWGILGWWLFTVYLVPYIPKSTPLTPYTKPFFEFIDKYGPSEGDDE